MRSVVFAQKTKKVKDHCCTISQDRRNRAVQAWHGLLCHSWTLTWGHWSPSGTRDHCSVSEGILPVTKVLQRPCDHDPTLPVSCPWNTCFWIGVSERPGQGPCAFSAIGPTPVSCCTSVSKCDSGWALCVWLCPGVLCVEEILFCVLTLQVSRPWG